VAGKVAPEIAKAAPASATEFTVSAVLPDEVRVSVWTEIVLMATLPKSKLMALAVSCGDGSGVPVPVRVILLVLPVFESLEMATVPVVNPLTAGSKETWRVKDCPGVRVAGNEIPDKLNPAPVRVTELTVTAAVPSEVSVTLLVTVVLRVALPKSTLVLLTLS